MKKALFLIIVLAPAMVVIALVGPSFIQNNETTKPRPTDAITTIQSGDDVFHVVPEKVLANDAILLIGADDNRYYILSEEKLRLIGPEFLAKITGDE